jgi:hypothetical protein
MRALVWVFCVVLVGCSAGGAGGDAGLPSDAGAADAGGDARDAGAPDAGGADAGQVDAGVPDGGASAGQFCAACVSSADCARGGFCLGGVTPRCSLDCSATLTCPGSLSCDTVGLGTGPRPGQTCAADDSVCGPFTRRAGLSCTETWGTYGQDFFATTCVGACHRHDGAWATVDDVRAGADAIRLAVELGDMPQGALLSQAETTRLLTWLACGAP